MTARAACDLPAVLLSRLDFVLGRRRVRRLPWAPERLFSSRLARSTTPPDVAAGACRGSREHDEADGHEPSLREDLAQHAVRLGAAAFGQERIRTVEELGRNRRGRDEVLNLDRLRRLHVGLLEVLVRHDDVLVLREPYRAAPDGTRRSGRAAVALALRGLGAFATGRALGSAGSTAWRASGHEGERESCKPRARLTRRRSFSC